MPQTNPHTTQVSYLPGARACSVTRDYFTGIEVGG